MQPIWCRACKLAWHEAILEAAEMRGAVTVKAQAVRCPRCKCHRGIRRIADEAVFRGEQPEVRWMVNSA